MADKSNYVVVNCRIVGILLFHNRHAECYFITVMLKWLKNGRFYGSIERIFDVSFRGYNLERRHKWGNPLMVKN